MLSFSSSLQRHCQDIIDSFCSAPLLPVQAVKQEHCTATTLSMMTVEWKELALQRLLCKLTSKCPTSFGGPQPHHSFHMDNVNKVATAIHWAALGSLAPVRHQAMLSLQWHLSLFIHHRTTAARRGYTPFLDLPVNFPAILRYEMVVETNACR